MRLGRLEIRWHSNADLKQWAKAVGLSTQAYNALRRGGYESTAEVRRATDEDLLSIRYLGKGSLEEIRHRLRGDRSPLAVRRQPEPRIHAVPTKYQRDHGSFTYCGQPTCWTKIPESRVVADGSENCQLCRSMKARDNHETVAV